MCVSLLWTWLGPSLTTGAICYVVPVLWMTSCLHLMMRIGQRIACTGWAKKVIPLVHILHCTRGITFLAHPVYVLATLAYVCRFGRYLCNCSLLTLVKHIITSHHMEKTEAGLKGLCIREIVSKIIMLLIYKILHYSTTVSDAIEICFIIIQHVLIRPELI